MVEKAPKVEAKPQHGRAGDLTPAAEISKHAPGSGEAFLALQRTAGNQAIGALVRDSGRTIDGSTLAEAETRFGERFGDVRIHTGADAARSSEALGADAWTEGSHIHFAAGKYAPGSTSGRTILAHELAHVVQQRRGGPPPRPFDPTASLEQDAAAAAFQFTAAGGPVAVQLSSGTGIARQESEEPWWQKKLNPLYQRALQVLPPETAVALEQANDFARSEIDKHHISDRQIDRLVETAGPALEIVSAYLNPPQQKAVGSDSRPAPSAKSQDSTSAASAPSSGRGSIRTDYPADPLAYHGVELYLTAEAAVENTWAKGVYKSAIYWIAPQFRTRTESVVFYIAYNPNQHRNEYVIGPDEMRNFLANENAFALSAAAAYPISGEPSEYEVHSLRAFTRVLQGNLGGAFRAWKEAWVAAVKDPGFWLQTAMMTAGEMAGPAGEIGAGAESRAAGETRPLGPPRLTSTEQTFGELRTELESVPENPAPLKGTGTSGFVSPKPLTFGYGAIDASQYATAEEYRAAIRAAGTNPTGAGQAWDHVRFPRGPAGRWEAGDPVDMPDAVGRYRSDWGTIRKRYWRNSAYFELRARAEGRSTHMPGSPDPILATSDQELATLRDTPTSDVVAPRVPGTNRAMEIEHFGIQQQVGRRLQRAGFSKNEAARLTGLADPTRLLPVSPLEHAFFDAEAHSFGRQRGDVTGRTWAQTPSADPRVQNPVEFMRDSELIEIGNRARSDPAIDLSRVPELRAALRAEAAKRKLPVQF